MMGASEAQIGRFPSIDNVLSAADSYLDHMGAISYVINNDVAVSLLSCMSLGLVAKMITMQTDWYF